MDEFDIIMRHVNKVQYTANNYGSMYEVSKFTDYVKQINRLLTSIMRTISLFINIRNTDLVT